MKHLRQWCAALACLVMPLASMAQTDFASVDQFSQWMSFYYTHPAPDNVAPALLAASRLGMFKGERPSPPVSGFLAGWLHANPERANQLIDGTAAMPDDEQGVLLIGITYSGLAQRETLWQTVAKRAHLFMRTPPGQQTVLDLPPENGPAVIDALWGYFMATGDEAAVLKIIQTLPWSERKSDAGKLAVGEAARWSLGSNVIQHARVLAICQAQRSQQPAEIANILKELIQHADAEKARPATDPGKTTGNAPAATSAPATPPANVPADVSTHPH